MVTQFVLRKQKKNAAGECPVQLIVYFDGARLTCATGEKCRPADWNDKRQQFRGSYPLTEEANNLLNRMATDVLTWWRKLRAAGEQPTLASLKAVLKPAAEPGPTAPVLRPMTELYEEYRQALRARGYSKETLRQRLVVRNWLGDFERDTEERLHPTTYEVATHDRLLAYLRFERKLAENTVATLVRNVKVFLRWCREERGMAVPVELRKLQGKAVDVVKMWLTAADLDALAATVLPDYLVKVRDVLLFCCYTGLRYSDVQALQPGNVEQWNGNRILRLVQTKTRAGVSIYLTEAAGAIIDKYAARADGQRARLLPVLANQVMNRFLKRVGKYAGLTAEVVLAERVAGEMVKKSVPKFELLTMHTARHTFATQSLLRGMPVEVLQKVMGHTRIQTTLVYAKVVEDLQHQTMQRVWEGQAGGREQETTGAVCRVLPGAAA
ncbi:tyrosine-type recombinase/integrase [Hymenobacter sp. RP-2-7]|uniref:Tyrosine-type recombinase/integrase n=1 Tax=Hymenobacter polaris TaxID=2682546 RepID=A0A7Y0AEJ2_9BACT|nr:tyrosine-type recombinase/integrase [Hymenobacter polaris]NML65936.1 tyrosine-type recombinase/integrase [Hymenobacter polaris]